MKVIPEEEQRFLSLVADKLPRFDAIKCALLKANSVFGNPLGTQKKARGRKSPGKRSSKKKTRRKKSPVSIGLRMIGESILQVRDDDEAKSTGLEVPKAPKKLPGRADPGYALCLNDLGAVYLKTREYAKAEAASPEGEGGAKKISARRTRSLRGTLNSLAKLYQSTGDFAQAESLLMDVLRMQEKVFGKEHARYVMALDNLGGFYVCVAGMRKARNSFVKRRKWKRSCQARSIPILRLG